MLRTQIYVTDDQRSGLDRIAKDEGVTLAEVIRRAIDSFLKHERRSDLQQLPEDLFGAIPDFEVPPRSEWDRGHG